MARVLLIDDDPDRTEVIARDLQAEGLEVITVNEKREAIRALDSSRAFDCAVVVIALPTGARLELAKELRQKFPSVRVALASGHRLKVHPTGQASERAMRLEPTAEDGRRLAKALRSRLCAA